MKEDVTFATRDGTTLHGWFFRPGTGSGPFPCVVMTHGFSGQIEHGLARFAEYFAGRGIAVLAYNHRGWGSSEGFPRLETNPYRQMQDMRDAITYVGMRDDVNKDRIGLWGTSYSGGVVLLTAAADRRLKCVVSLVPVVSGSGMARRGIGEGNFDAHLDRLYAAREAELRGEGIQYRRHTDHEGTINWYAKADPDKLWENRITVASHDMLLEFEPGDMIHRISPTPLLMIVGDHDTRVCTDLQMEAYGRAREPKKIVVLPCDHYEPYIEMFEEAAAPAAEWFVKYLIETTPVRA